MFCDLRFVSGLVEKIIMNKRNPLIVYVILFFFSFPIIWVVWFLFCGAFLSPDEAQRVLEPALSLEAEKDCYAIWTLLPTWPTLQPILQLLLDTPQFFSAFWNTCVQAFGQIVGQFLVATPAAWAFSKFHFKGKKMLFVVYIALMVLPFQVFMVPNYLISTQLHIFDTPLAVILPGIFSAFPIFIMRRSFDDVPDELIEAAKLDGATEPQVFFRIGLPLGYAGVYAAVVLCFIEAWNSVEQPLLFLPSQQNWPLALYINSITEENLEIAMAASLISFIPALLIFLYGQSYLEIGIQTGSVKG